jgi:hypothetical protein
VHDLILLAGDTLAIFVSLLVGMKWHGAIVARRGNKPPPPPNLNCGCGHVLAYHDPVSGVCSFVSQVMEYRPKVSKNGAITGNIPLSVDKPCQCKQYTGELTADWYARSIMRGSDDTGMLEERKPSEDHDPA